MRSDHDHSSSQMRKLRLREVKSLTQVHSVQVARSGECAFLVMFYTPAKGIGTDIIMLKGDELRLRKA